VAGSLWCREMEKPEVAIALHAQAWRRCRVAIIASSSAKLGEVPNDSQVCYIDSSPLFAPYADPGVAQHRAVRIGGDADFPAGDIGNTRRS
jgi:hypothetical protein